MPVEVVYRNGEKWYRWGKAGKLYRSRALAEKQGRAIHASKNSKK